MAISSPLLSSYHSTCITPTIISPWTFTDHKRFEQILAIIPSISQNSDPWISIAAQLGKTPMEVKQHYDMLLHDVVLIESGRVPLPRYADDHHHHDHIHDDDDDEKWTSMDNDRKGKGKQIRKKGEQWTTDEHKLFLLGLKKCGKGDWKSISRNFVTSKSPTQVASHAQKFFLRQTQSTNQNNRKRTSIHDTTEVDHDSLTDLICRGVVPLEVLARTPNANLRHHP